MAFEINVCKDSNINYNTNFRFYQNVITIGEDISNNLRLRSGKNVIAPILAENHLKIGTFYLTYIGSDEGTFIEDKKIIANKPHIINDRAIFKIGDYCLTFHLMKAAKKDTQENSQKTSIKNEINVLLDTLEFINTFDDSHLSKEPESKFQQAFEQALIGRDFEKIFNQMSKIIFQRNPKNKKVNADESEFIIDIFLILFTEIFDMSAKISQEFIGAYTIHRRDSKQMIHPGTLKNYIFAPDLSPEERYKRKAFLKEEIHDVISRQIAIFDGYKSSLKHGINDILKILDPRAAKENLLNKTFKMGSFSVHQKYFPFFIYQRAFKNLIRIHDDLSYGEDKNVEDKYFKPAFISGYLKSINSESVGSKRMKS
jgi:pSer/pThr/pTyr-binding forkhead associated (FHA) protein